MRKNNYLFLCGLFICLLAISCKKNGGLNKPSLNVNMLDKEGAGGDILEFDMNASGFDAIKGFKVEVNYNNTGSKTVLDSTFSEPKGVFTYVYRYKIPENAKKGESATLKFTATDKNGNNSTVEKSITVTASQPQLSLSVDNLKPNAGDVLTLHIAMKSSEKNLGKIEIKESRHNQAGVLLETKDWQNEDNVAWDYEYTVPKDASGEKIIILVIAKNSDGIERYDTFTFNVK